VFPKIPVVCICSKIGSCTSFICSDGSTSIWCSSVGEASGKSEESVICLVLTW
jgi:hypothetical protein